MSDTEKPDDVVEVDRLLLAAWLQLNGQSLVERRLRNDAKIIYTFDTTDEVQRLIKRWDEKTEREMVMARFSRIVSFEIQKAVRMRRAAGVSTRIRAAETT